ncbi:MAG: hypothetical protein ACPLZH_00500, partial [Minisyncoccales bacterium]
SFLQIFLQKGSFLGPGGKNPSFYFFPFLSFLIFLQLPAGFLLYIFFTSFFSLIFQKLKL